MVVRDKVARARRAGAYAFDAPVARCPISAPLEETECIIISAMAAPEPSASSYLLSHGERIPPFYGKDRGILARQDATPGRHICT